MDANAPILFFDSGVGGLSVLGPTRELLPNAPIVYAADSAGFPYGKRSEAEIASRVPALLGRLVERFHPRLAVIACNTASTIALDHVRVGARPAGRRHGSGDQARGGNVEDARDRRARHRSDGPPALCRRPRREVRRGLHDHPPRLARSWSSWPRPSSRGEEVSVDAVRAAAQPMFDAPDGDRIDTVVLACTHFPLLEDELARRLSRTSPTSTAAPASPAASPI